MRLCCKCSVGPAMRQERPSYCLPCHAENMRDWRKAHPYQTRSVTERFKSTVRAIANVYQRRGKIIKCPCYFCGDQVAEKHHPDYSQPLLVVWLCRPCHLQVHQFEIPGVDVDVEQLAIQWDEKKSPNVKHIKRLHKQQMERRLTAAKLRQAERQNKRTG